MNSTTVTIFVLLGVLLVGLIIYSLFLFHCYSSQTFIFAPYAPVDPPTNSFFPQGTLTPLTAAQMEQKNNVINSLLNNTTQNGSS